MTHNVNKTYSSFLSMDNNLQNLFINKLCDHIGIEYMRFRNIVYDIYPNGDGAIDFYNDKNEDIYRIYFDYEIQISYYQGDMLNHILNIGMVANLLREFSIENILNGA
jgi:hypothetical protein